MTCVRLTICNTRAKRKNNAVLSYTHDTMSQIKMINYSHNDVFQTIVFIEFHLYERYDTYF